MSGGIRRGKAAHTGNESGFDASLFFFLSANGSLEECAEYRPGMVAWCAGWASVTKLRGDEGEWRICITCLEAVLRSGCGRRGSKKVRKHGTSSVVDDSRRSFPFLSRQLDKKPRPHPYPESSERALASICNTFAEMRTYTTSRYSRENEKLRKIRFCYHALDA